MALVDYDKVQHMVDSKAIKPEQVTGLTIEVAGEKKAILATKQSGSPVKKARHNQGWWPESKKIEAATLYAALGNVRRTALMAKVPISTLERWTNEDWFMQIMQRVKREENYETDRRFTAIVDKALTKIEERITEGDYVYDIRQGKAVPIPVSARDLTIVTGTLFDKRQLLRGEATQIKASATNDDHLRELATKFAEYVKAKEKTVLVTGSTETLENKE